MSRIDTIRRFYDIPRSKDQAEALFAMFHPDVVYVGVGREEAHGTPALRRMFGKYAMSRTNVSGCTFDLRHMAEAGAAVLVDMVATFIIDGAPETLLFSVVFHVDDAGLITYWQEHYDLRRHESLFGPTPVTEQPARVS